MTVTREQLLTAVEEDDTQPFLDIIDKHNCHDDLFNLEELLSTLSRPQLQQFWGHLQTKCSHALLSMHPEAPSQELENAHSVMQGIVLAATATISPEEPYTPESLFETAVVLHGVLETLGSVKLSGAIAQLCQTWWHRNFEGRDHLALQTIQYLLDSTLQVKPTQVDIKRVWQMREALLSVNLENESSANIRALLLRCLNSTHYLRLDQGRKLLSFIFGLNVQFIDEVHKTIKLFMASCPVAMLKWYGEVYFRAWKESTGQIQEKLENDCIQDLMYHAIHSKSMGHSVRHVLSSMHHQKKQRGVDGLLHRLYAPILWRAFNMPHCEMRASALHLLIDVFPLRDPDANLEEADILLQKQFDILQNMLFDPSPHNRCIAVQGVCSIVNVYWELIPPHIVKALLLKLVQDLAWDSTSANVRAAVIMGMTSLLDQHLAHPLLKALLPELKDLFHDGSEKVRVAFAELLLKVKGVKAIKFWNIVPVEHILARMEVDSAPVIRRLVALVFNSYVPMNRDCDVQVTRCVCLVEKNPIAARKFFTFMLKHMTIGDTAKYMLMLWKCIVMAVKTKIPRANSSTPVGQMPNGIERDILGSSDEDETPEKENVAEERAVGNTDQQQQDDGGEQVLSADNTEVIAGLLEVLIILWAGLSPQLHQPGNTDICDKLKAKFSRSLPAMLQIFEDQRVMTSLVMLSGYMPAKAVPSLSRSMISRLRKLKAGATADDFNAILEAMCNWGKVGDLMELLSDWMDAALVDTDEERSNKSRRPSSRVTFQDPLEPQPALALTMIDYMLKMKVCRECLLKGGHVHLCEFLQTLQKVQSSVERRLASTEPLSELCSDELLTEAMALNLRLTLLLHEENEKSAITRLEQIIPWADTQLMPLLRHRRQHQRQRRLLDQGEDTLLASGSSALGDTMSLTFSQSTLSSTMSGDSTLGGKRALGGEGRAELVAMAASIIESVLSMASDMMLLGIGTSQLLSQLANFVVSLLHLDDSSRFLPLVAQLLFHLTEMALSLPQDDLNGTELPLTGLLSRTVTMLGSFVKHRKEQANRILPGLRSIIGETLNIYFRYHSLQGQSSCDVMATIASSVLSSIKQTLQQDAAYEVRSSVAELPTLAAFLLGALGNKPDSQRQLVREFSQMLKSVMSDNTDVDVTTLLALLHILHTLTSGRARHGELKECVSGVETGLDMVVLPEEDVPDPAHTREQMAAGQDLLKVMKGRLGMVV